MRSAIPPDVDEGNNPHPQWVFPNEDKEKLRRP